MLKVKDYLRTAAVCVVIAFVCLFGYLLLQNLCSELFIRWGLETRKTVDLFQRGFWFAFFVYGIFYPVVEELIFRLFGCKLLQKCRLPMWAVVIISATVFTIYHWSWSQVIYQFLMGVWFAWIYLKTQKIGWTMLIHFINNTFIITYTYFAGTGDSTFNLSAASVAWAIALAVGTSMTVFCLIKKGIPHDEK